MRRTAEHWARSGFVFVTLTLLGWASVPLFLKYFTRHIDAWTSNGWRYGFSALLWLPVLVVGLWRRSLPPHLFSAALLPAAFNTAGQLLFALAPYYIDPGLMAFLLRLQIVVTTLGAYFFFPDERRVLGSRPFWAGLALVVVGSVGTILLGHTVPRGATAVGIAMAVGSGLLYGGYGLSVRGKMHGIHPIVSFAAISQYTAIGMVALMLALGERSGAAAWSMQRWQIGMLLLSAIVGIALGHVFYYVALARLGVAVSSGVIQLTPFATAAASVMLFDEKLTGWQWASGTVAVIGAVVMLEGQQRLRRREAAAIAEVEAATAAGRS